jgi:hypothetical protein
MANVVIPYRFRVKRDTAANFTAANTLLLSGEFGLETDTRKLKIGDGVTAWNSLPYVSTTDVPEGSNLYHTAQRVRDTVLTGLSTATNAVIAATDTVLSALGKLQAQISGLIVQTITDGDTTHAPSGDAVFDALALKAPKDTPAFTGNASFDTNVLYVDATNDRVGIGTTAPSAKLSVSEKLRVFDATPPGAASSTDVGYLFGSAIPSGLITEVSGAILTYGINVPQFGPRDTARTGGIFRLDTRADQDKFVVFGYPTGGSDATERISVNLGNGNTHLVQSGGNVAIGYAVGSDISNKLQVNGNIFAQTNIRPGSYTVATVPSASTAGAGAMIYVSDEVGGGVPAFSDGTNWRRVTDRAIVS